jgi:phage shock protein A
MFRMLRAIFKIFSSVLSTITAGFIDLEKSWFRNNTGVIGVKYDTVIEKMQADGNRVYDSLVQLVKMQETRKQRVAKVQADLDVLKKKRDAAFALALKRAEKFGSDIAARDIDPEYMKLQSAYTDYNSTMKSKTAEIDSSAKEIATQDPMIAKLKVELQSLEREVEKTRDKKATTIANVSLAKSAEKWKTVTGLDKSGYSELSRELDDINNEALADMKVSAELSGNSAKDLDSELLIHAERSEASDEFDRLIAAASKVETSATSEEKVGEKAKLPE